MDGAARKVSMQKAVSFILAELMSSKDVFLYLLSCPLSTLPWLILAFSHQLKSLHLALYCLFFTLIVENNCHCSHQLKLLFSIRASLFWTSFYFADRSIALT
uniref:Uncharacterized protein n=1 Tax=Opuntia streptacantha TaxID=393608 RepID=A0A7C9E376_OPUST